MQSIALLIVAVTIALTTSCSKDKNVDPAASKATASKVTSAPSVKPGSYEDWCNEHQVPESQCTECHPELIPAFKATGDWCEEHKMPESQCRKCKPDLKIVRPPKPT